jgi:hypothetical protein
MENVHRLLKRQVAKYLDEDQKQNPSVLAFLEAIQEAYANYDKDYEQLERTLEISSNELFRSNETLNTLNAELEQKVSSRTAELEEANNVLLLEKNVREAHEAEQAKIDALLEASNKAINKLILCDNIKESFHEIFSEIITAGHMQEVFFCVKTNAPKEGKRFTMLGNHSMDGKLNEGLFNRLCFALNNHFDIVQKTLLKNEPVFLRQLEELINPDLAAQQDGEIGRAHV